jgi:hypothetical protein
MQRKTLVSHVVHRSILDCIGDAWDVATAAQEAIVRGQSNSSATFPGDLDRAYSKCRDAYTVCR